MAADIGQHQRKSAQNDEKQRFFADGRCFVIVAL